MKLQRKGPGRLCNCSEKGQGPGRLCNCGKKGRDGYETAAKRAGTAVQLRRKGPRWLWNCGEGRDGYETAAKRAGTAMQLRRKGRDGYATAAKRAGTAVQLRRKGPGRPYNCSEKDWDGLQQKKTERLCNCSEKGPRWLCNCGEGRDGYETAAKRAGTAMKLRRKGPGRLCNLQRKRAADGCDKELRHCGEKGRKDALRLADCSVAKGRKGRDGYATFAKNRNRAGTAMKLRRRYNRAGTGCTYQLQERKGPNH